PSLSQRIQYALGDVLASRTVAQNTRGARFEAMAAPGLSGLVAAVNGVLGPHPLAEPVRQPDPAPVAELNPWLAGQPAE
ncbi:MAG: hypothetical protein WBA35_09725, partial [Litorimonas sp.]